MKREYRELPSEVKEKISTSMIGKPKSEAHKQAISKALKEYWKSVPHKPTVTEKVGE